MRILHTSDWHLGRSFFNERLLDDQAYLLDRLISLARETKPQTLLVSGDLYDRAVPSPDAVELLDDVLSRIILALDLHLADHDASLRALIAHARPSLRCARVALGHLHRAQPVHDSRIRYSGAPLKYAFSEAHLERSVTFVELDARASLNLKRYPLHPSRELRCLEGFFDDLLRTPPATVGPDDLISITLLDEHPVLDAVCFALFGECSGEVRKTDTVRSRHADPRTRTEVTFDFSLGSDRFRVWRTLRWERPKLKRDGLTVEKPDATLWRRTGLPHDTAEGRLLAAGYAKVAEEIRQLLGFTSRQFRQVVVLPQGEFQRFLHAGSKEREAILEVLFQTTRFNQFQEFLGQRAKAADQSLRDKLNQRDFLFEQESSHYDQLQDRLNLAAAAAGKNNFKINLQRFVQLAQLDRVLEAASLRLRLVSRGRYHLQRVPEPETMVKAGGLDIQVLDSYAGQARPVSTLSGGEGFPPVLSLALGLADTVQSCAGSLRLESMFPDLAAALCDW